MTFLSSYDWRLSQLFTENHNVGFFPNIEKVFRYWVTKVKERERERKKEIYYKLYS